MNPLRRAFVAVVPPAPVLDALELVVARVDQPGAPPTADLRWTPRGQWHTTLRFLGPVAAPDRVVGALQEALAGTAPGRVALGGSGAFPTPVRPSVLWVGLREGADWLVGLAGAVERAAVAAGLAPESRPFRPHLTLARVRTPRPIQDLVAEIGSAPIGRAWTVDEVVLFESDTRAAGAVHHAICALPLASGSFGSSHLASSPLASPGDAHAPATPPPAPGDVSR